jgi:hypothetical protein
LITGLCFGLLALMGLFVVVSSKISSLGLKLLVGRTEHCLAEFLCRLSWRYEEPGDLSWLGVNYSDLF